jgi:acetyl esterase/lipase
MTVSPNRSATWTKSLDGVLFGIHKIKKKEGKPEAEKTDDKAEAPATPAARPDETPADEKVDLVLWHWQDKRLQSQQQVQESADKNFSYLAIFRPAEKKFIRLADDDLRDVTPAPEHRFAIGRTDDDYELMGNLDGRRYQDLYAIDLASGKRTLIMKKARFANSASPTGTHYLYYEDGHYFTFDMTTGQATNITKAVPTSFVNIEDDHNVVKPPTPVAGWSQDGKFVLLSDNWDVWQVPVGGGTATNLTLDGRKDQIRYRGIVDLDAEKPGHDLTKPVFISVYSEWTKKAGIGVLEPGKPGVKRLMWEDAAFGPPQKARKADLFLYTRQTYKEPPDFYISDATLADGKRLTSLGEGQEKFLWSAGTMLVDYTSAKGDRLQGALHLPANYEKGKSYPTIVYFYEKMSNTIHNYARPTANGFNRAVYTSNGYAVFNPDVTYKVNDPGMSAVWCVVPAVKAAIATGVVDAKKVGIHGHSWGGYQTAFLVTQTDIFAAAVAGAPLTNMISMYSLIYKNTGGTNGAIFESSQGRFTSGPWDNWEAYTRNSPVAFAKNVKTPLIILHNDKDGAVDFTQGVEYYNTLRRLQKPVVMLEYPGENHGLAKRANQKDYTVRMKEFFDHHLMGKPAPKWWLEGVPRLDMNDHLKSRQPGKPTTSPTTESGQKGPGGN